MMDGEDVYRARLEACLAEAEAATLPQVKERLLAAARSWQMLLDQAVALKPPASRTMRREDRVERHDD